MESFLYGLMEGYPRIKTQFTLVVEQIIILHAINEINTPKMIKIGPARSEYILELNQTNSRNIK